MKKYELMFIVKPTIEENEVKKVFESMKTLLKNMKSNIIEEKEMGQRQLAYEIKKHSVGYYFYLLVESTPEPIKEFERVAQINENIIRSLVVKKEM